jgi:hypothetical protein
MNLSIITIKILVSLSCNMSCIYDVIKNLRLRRARGHFFLCAARAIGRPNFTHRRRIEPRIFYYLPKTHVHRLLLHMYDSYYFAKKHDGTAPPPTVLPPTMPYTPSSFRNLSHFLPIDPTWSQDPENSSAARKFIC